jgi:hypothetical protein
MDRHGVRKSQTWEPVSSSPDPRGTHWDCSRVSTTPLPVRRSKHEKQWRCVFIFRPFLRRTGPTTSRRDRCSTSTPCVAHPGQVSTTQGKSRPRSYAARSTHGVPAVWPCSTPSRLVQAAQAAAKHLDVTRRRKETSGCRQPTSSATQRRLLMTSTLRAALEPPFRLVTCHFPYFPSMGCDRPKNRRTYMDSHA